MKTLCQLILDRRDTDDVTQLVASRPSGRARISICLVLALCQWQTVKPDVATGHPHRKDIAHNPKRHGSY